MRDVVFGLFAVEVRCGEPGEFVRGRDGGEVVACGGIGCVEGEGRTAAWFEDGWGESERRQCAGWLLRTGRRYR